MFFPPYDSEPPGNQPNLPTLEDFPELSGEMQDLELDGGGGAAAVANAPPIKREEEPHIFENYSFEHTYSPDLPITQFHKEVIATIESTSVTVIQGILKCERKSRVKMK